MPLVHTLITSGEQWLGFAKSKLRSLEKLGMSHVGQNFIMPDGNPLSVRIAGEHHFIRIGVADWGYEFFMPEPMFGSWPGENNGKPATQDPATTGGKAVVAGSGVKYRGVRKPLPVFSEVLTPTDDGPKFETRPVEPLWASRPEDLSGGVVNAPNFFPTWASWQNQKGPEYISWPGGDGQRGVVTSTRGFGPGLSNMAGFFMPSNLPPPGGTGFLDSYANDAGKDVPPAYIKHGSRPGVMPSSQSEQRGVFVMAGAPALPDHIDWRRAAVHVATSEEYGRRSFFVLSDTHGQFHVYPVKDYVKGDGVSTFRSLSGDKIKTYTPPYPEWVAGPAQSGSIHRSAENREAFLWEFNKDATKIVGVPFSEQEGKAWRVRGGAEYTKFFIQTMSDAYLIRPDDDEADYQGDDWTPGLWQVPGLVELGLSINITGKDDMDYEAVFTLAQQSHYLTNGFRYYVSAAYLMKNRRMGDDAEAILGAQEDALLTAEIELFWVPPENQPRIGRNTRFDDGNYTYTLPDYPGLTFKNPEVHPDLPEFDIRASTARAQLYGLRNLAHAYYTVRNHETQEVVRRFKLCGKFGSCIRRLVGSEPEFRLFPYQSQVLHGGLNVIAYADLRSLSFLVTSLHSEDGITRPSGSKRSAHLYVFNEHQESVTTFDGSTEDAAADTGLNDGPTEAMEQIPGEDTENGDTAFYFLQQASLYLIQLGFFRHIPVHPHGHWACGFALNYDPEGKLDIIQAYKPDGTPMQRTSHREQYNMAFNQNRPPDFHGADIGDTDMAPMSTTGIWLTF